MSQLPSERYMAKGTHLPDPADETVCKQGTAGIHQRCSLSAMGPRPPVCQLSAIRRSDRWSRSLDSEAV